MELDGFRDADFEMRALQRAGNRSSALRRKGICTHGWWKSEPTKAVCLHCGKEFKSDAELREESRELMGF